MAPRSKGNAMGAGASASEQSQLLAEARAGGATQEEIDAYMAEHNLNPAQRAAPPSHAELTTMGFSPDAVAMALSLGLESLEDATQWLLDHPDAGGETEADVQDEEALLHYAIAESILQKAKDDELTSDERRLVPWATEVVELHDQRRRGNQFDDARFGELRDALKRERDAIDRDSIKGGRADWVTALCEVDELRKTDASATRLVAKIRELERELLSAAARRSDVDELRKRASLSGADAEEAERKAARCDALLRRSDAAHVEAEARREDIMAFCSGPGSIGKETLERVYLYLKDKVHNKEPLEASDVKDEVFGPQGVDEDAGAELVPKVLQLILLEEDELLLKNLVKGVFEWDTNDVDESDDELLAAFGDGVAESLGALSTSEDAAALLVAFRDSAADRKPVPPIAADAKALSPVAAEAKFAEEAHSIFAEEARGAATLEEVLKEAKAWVLPPGEAASFLDAPWTQQLPPADVRAVEASLAERDRNERDARDAWHDAVRDKASTDLRFMDAALRPVVTAGVAAVAARTQKKRDKLDQSNVAAADAAEKIERIDAEGAKAERDAREALERFATSASRGLEQAAARSLQNKIAARARLRARLEKRDAREKEFYAQLAPGGQFARDTGQHDGECPGAINAHFARQEIALAAVGADSDGGVSAEDLAAVVANMAARDERGRRRRAAERAADRETARRKLLELLAARPSNAEGEFRAWAELCRADDADDLRARRLDEAALCGGVYGECAFRNAPIDAGDVTRLALEHDAARKQLSDSFARRHAEKRMRGIERARAHDVAAADAALEALDGRLGEERKEALDALERRHVDALRGRLLLARVDADHVLRVLPAAARIGDGLVRAVADLRSDGSGVDGLRAQAAQLIARHALEHERVDDMLSEARLKQQEALRRRVRERILRHANIATDELEEWSELEADVDRREVQACAAHHASFCGEAVGICQAAGGAADMTEVADLVRDHDGALRALAARLHADRTRRRADLLRRLRDRKGRADVEGDLVQLDAELEAERRSKMHEFVALRRSKVLDCVSRSGGTFISVKSRGAVDETKSDDGSDGEVPFFMDVGDATASTARAKEDDYRALFATLQSNEARAAENRRGRRADDARRHKESIERRLARRRNQRTPETPMASPMTDVVSQIEAARDASSMARRLDANRRKELVAPLAYSASTGADAVPARKFGKGMGFSSGPKSPEAKREGALPKRILPRAGSVRVGAGFSSKPDVAEAKG